MAEVLEGTAIVSIDTSSNGSIKCLIWRKEDDEIVVDSNTVNLTISRFNIAVKKEYVSTELYPNPCGFYELEQNFKWEGSPADCTKSLLVEAEYNGTTIRVPLVLEPSSGKLFSQVFIQGMKLGVMAMTQNLSLDEITNTIYDTVRKALQVCPGSSDSYYGSTTATTGGGWGDPVEFGFECIGFSITNNGAQTLEFSLDGITTHGTVPPEFIKWYDWRRASQVYVRASSAVSVEIECW